MAYERTGSSAFCSFGKSAMTSVARTIVRTCPGTRSVFACKQTMSSASSADTQAQYEDWIEHRFDCFVLWNKLVADCEALNAPSCSFEEFLRADEPSLKKARVIDKADASTDQESADESPLFESDAESNDIVEVEHFKNPCVGTGIRWVQDSDDEMVWERS